MSGADFGLALSDGFLHVTLSRWEEHEANIAASHEGGKSFGRALAKREAKNPSIKRLLRSRPLNV